MNENKAKMMGTLIVLIFLLMGFTAMKGEAAERDPTPEGFIDYRSASEEVMQECMKLAHRVAYKEVKNRPSQKQKYSKIYLKNYAECLKERNSDKRERDRQKLT